MLTIEPAIVLPPHDAHALLNKEERSAHVHIEDLVVSLLGGVENIAAIGERGGVDQRVDTAEALVRLGDHVAAVGDLRKVRLDEHSRTTGRRNFTRDPLAALRVPPASHNPRRATFGEQPRDGLAQALRAAGDDRDLAVQICRPSVGRSRGRVSLGREGLGHGRLLLKLFAQRAARAPFWVFRMKQKFYSQVNMERIFFFVPRRAS